MGGETNQNHKETPIVQLNFYKKYIKSVHRITSAKKQTNTMVEL